jgi:hypothetical protein
VPSASAATPRLQPEDALGVGEYFYCQHCEAIMQPSVVKRWEKYNLWYHPVDRYDRAAGQFGHGVIIRRADSSPSLDAPTSDAVVSGSRLLRDKSGRVGSAGEGSRVQLEPSLLSERIEYEYTYSTEETIIFFNEEECRELAEGGPIFRREVRRGPWELL